MATKTLARWQRVGKVPYQALPLLRFFAYKIRAREKVRKGEGEPGDEARKDLPFGMYGYSRVVMFKEKVYIGGGIASSDKELRTVIIYDPKLDFYDTLPPYTYKYFAMAVVNNQLVLIGGRDVQTNKKTNKLGVWNEQSKRWTYPLPQMTTVCHSASVATHNNRWLVVIGGHDDGSVLTRVEILDTTESRQWYHAASLPQPCTQVLPVTISNVLSLGWLH